MKYLKRFNESESTDPNQLNFYEGVDSDMKLNVTTESGEIKEKIIPSYIGAYMIIDPGFDTQTYNTTSVAGATGSITVLNLQEREDTRCFFADNRVPYTFIPYKVRLPKSQIQILGPVDNIFPNPTSGEITIEFVKGFFWIKIPKWLVKNNPGLKIMRVNKIKRVSNNSIFTKSLKPEMIDDNVRKYISSIDKDNRSKLNLDLIIKRSMTP